MAEDRVKADMGAGMQPGTLVETPKGLTEVGMVMVLFDSPPPWRYNLGQNPVALFLSDISKLEADHD